MIIVGRLSQILFKADRVCAEEWDCEQHIKLIMTDDMYPAHHTGVFGTEVAHLLEGFPGP